MSPIKEVESGTLDWVTVITYLLAMLFIGVYFIKRANQSTNSFFTASGRLPPWVVGLSIYATTLSTIILISTPEKAFLTGWSRIVGNIATVAIIPLLIYFHVPFSKELKVTSAHEYLGARFGSSTCVIDSLLFVAYHSGRVAIVIYLPILAITPVLDMNPCIVVSFVSLLYTSYTFPDGFEGMAWSNFAQGVISLGDALVIIILGVVNIKDGFGTIFANVIEHKKLVSADNWELDTAAAAIPVIFLGNIFNNLYQYAASQDVAQCYQASNGLEKTNKSLWTSSILTLISAPLLYGMGTMLYPFYTHKTVLPKGFNTSSVVPYLILTEIPPFIAGLLVAAIFAVIQSTILSSLDSMSACISINIKQRFFGKGNEQHEINFTRFIIIIAGIFGSGMSLYLITSNSNDLRDLLLFVTGLFDVPLAGVFIADVLIKRTDTFDVICGLILGIISAYVCNGAGEGNSPFYVSTISFTVVFVFTCILSFIVPSKRRKDIMGLTVFEGNKPSTHVSGTATKK